MAEIDVDTAKAMAAMYEAAEKAAPLRQARREMRARRKEWEAAIKDLEHAAGEGAIELIGSVTRYMQVLGGSRGNWCTVIKRTSNDSLMCEDPDDPRPAYIGFHDSASPVVVRR